VVFVILWEDGCPTGSRARLQARSGRVWQLLAGKIERMTPGYFDIEKGRATAERPAEERG
jgi:hypothetical protein